MNNYYRFNFETETIIASASVIKKAGNPSTPEYRALAEAKKKQPTFKVVPKQISRKENKRSYHGLTFESMKDFIALHDNTTKRLDEFAAVRKVAKVKGAEYPLAKKWFLANYSDFNDSEFEQSLLNEIIHKKETNAEKKDSDNIAPINVKSDSNNINEVA